jgi:hypothetical protein
MLSRSLQHPSSEMMRKVQRIKLSQTVISKDKNFGYEHWGMAVYPDGLSLTSSFTPCPGLVEETLRPAIKLLT